ncbi:MAG: hypothetical protein LBF26_03340 [Puniceicoccales bacterium]|jgi:hypothetical protein|nr:hypothetical protein [Puniceicoccales bacterium]
MGIFDDPKTTVKFWKEKIYKPKRQNAHGETVISRYFYARFSHEKKTINLCLQTGNALEAAKKARDAYVLLKAEGREAMQEVYRARSSLDTIHDVFRYMLLPALGLHLEDLADTDDDAGVSDLTPGPKRLR